MDIPKQYSSQEIESEVSNMWDIHKIAEKTIGLDESKPLFSFLEGPPTANAPPGLHHVQSRFFKDVVLRHKFMQGYSVPRKGGWDCHGLPVEVQVEKKLGLKTKKDVLSFGIGKFNDLCRKDIFTYIEDWNTLTKKMAFWIDLKDPYITLKNNYIESVWWSLKELHKKGLLYKDHKVVPYCPRCETPLSSHEVALGYNDVTEDSITTKFKVKDEPYSILAWTTTPWTTPSNVGLAVGSEIDYAIVEHEGHQYVLALDVVSRYFQDPKVIRTLKGAELVGKEYEPLFDYFIGKVDKPAWKVIATEFVNTDEGTGIVHQAPAFGEEDYNAIKKEGMAFVQPVNESGRFTKEVSDFEGEFVKDADSKIISRLEKDGLLFSVEKITHSYPHCWRCDTPLLYYALKSWFVRVSAMKEQLLKNNDKIQWYPGHIKDGRFGEWLKNVKDWALSRNKFWGTPLPIWACKCGQITAIGSTEELEEASGLSLKDFDLHKPGVDTVKIPCKCGESMIREPYVIDTWYDSGAASFAQLHYPFENKEQFEKYFPYSYITESIDQTRGWFYTLHVLGTLLFDSPAFKSVLVGGLLVDEKGEKMSKSKGNIINPDEVFSTVGADSVRLQLCASSPENTKRFGYDLVRENVTPLLTTLWNTALYYKQLARTDESLSELKIEDKWIISRTNSLITEFTQALEDKALHRCLELLKSYTVDDLSRWYVRLIRNRNDDACIYSMDYALKCLVKLMAPFTPYLSEFLYIKLLRQKDEPTSVHLCQWPNAEVYQPELESQMNVAREVTQSINSLREGIKRGIRWPIKKVIVITTDSEVDKAVKTLEKLILDQTNVMEIEIQQEFVHSKKVLKADYAKLGPQFADITPKIIAQVAMLGQDQLIKKLEESGEFTLEIGDKNYLLKKDQFIINTQIPENFNMASMSKGAVYIDNELTEQMKTEGMLRETIRIVQQTRKEQGLNKSDKINIHIKTDIANTLKSHNDRILEKVGARNLEISTQGPDENYKLEKVHTIKEHKFEIFFRPLA